MVKVVLLSYSSSIDSMSNDVHCVIHRQQNDPTAPKKSAARRATMRPSFQTTEAGAKMPVRMEGWMNKQGHFVKNWKTRWFVLDGTAITYAPKEVRKATTSPMH